MARDTRGTDGERGVTDASARQPVGDVLGPAPASFTAVDAPEQDVAALVAMMDATDAWAAVQAARRRLVDRSGAWASRSSGVAAGRPVVDVGCGPGTFGALVRAAHPGRVTVDLDRSRSMLAASRRRHPDAAAVAADVAALPLASGCAGLVHIERVLQWTADPDAALAELWRAVGDGGVLAVTDTDWSTFAVDHPDPTAASALAEAAVRWVPHPTLARDLPARLAALPRAEVVGVDHDVAVLDAWDPDAPTQADGPPGLPLHSIAAALDRVPGDLRRARLDVLADAARSGSFRARLTLVTVVVRRMAR